MSRTEHLLEAARYARLAREAANQVVTACSREYYEQKAAEHRALAGQ